MEARRISFAPVWTTVRQHVHAGQLLDAGRHILSGQELLAGDVSDNDFIVDAHHHDDTRTNSTIVHGFYLSAQHGPECLYLQFGRHLRRRILSFSQRVRSDLRQGFCDVS
jgi:hypothetical protein